ncbi:MAG: phosphate ABC transporter substrate-binding protein [Candidatus Eisenbacteria bacterium]
MCAVVGLVSCGGGQGRAKAVTIKGSDTMVILGQRWAERFMETNPGAAIQVTGGGSGTGIAALINGTTDICESSRPMKDAERQQMQTKYGTPPHEIAVAKDGLAVYVHQQNPVRELSLAQIRDMYTGKITRWKEVGGPDAPITLYGRENSSGTYEYFKEHVLEKADFNASVQTLPGTAAVISAVGKDPNGVGYGGAAYLKGVQEVAIKADADSAGILPTAENVLSGTYPISRDLYFYLRKAPEGAVKTFIDFALSDEGQKIVGEVGYYPIR